MKYNATVKFNNKQINIKVTNKELEGVFTLEDFLDKIHNSRPNKKEEFIMFKMREDEFRENIKHEEEMEQYIIDRYDGIRDISMSDEVDDYITFYNLPKKLRQLVNEPNNKQSILGNRLKELRAERKLSQEDVANNIGLLRSTYSLYEISYSEPDIQTLIKLSNFFKVSIDWLVGKV